MRRESEIFEQWCDENLIRLEISAKEAVYLKKSAYYNNYLLRCRISEFKQLVIDELKNLFTHKKIKLRKS